MFKKLIIVVIVLSPVWFSLLVGYPVVSDEVYGKKVAERPGISISRRCSAVGDFREYRMCFPVSEKLQGISLISEVRRTMGDISPVVPIIVAAATVSFILLSVLFIVG